MDIMEHQPTMVTPLRPMAIGILITDRGTIQATGTVATMGPDIMIPMDIGGK